MTDESGKRTDADMQAGMMVNGTTQTKRTVSQVMGEIVWLMTMSPAHKTLFLSDLEWMAMPPILLEQFRIFYTKDRPVGVALWAKLSEEAEARLEAGQTRLKPEDWKSGDRLWVVNLIAPYGGQEDMLKDLKSNVFPNESFKFHHIKDGKRETVIVPADKSISEAVGKNKLDTGVA